MCYPCIAGSWEHAFIVFLTWLLEVRPTVEAPKHHEAINGGVCGTPGMLDADRVLAALGNDPVEARIQGTQLLAHLVDGGALSTRSSDVRDSSQVGCEGGTSC